MSIQNGSTATPDPPATVIDRARGDQPHVTAPVGTTRLVPVNQLLPGDSPRLTGESAEHARVLAESDASLPPILVHRETMRVVDGAHRVRAAKLRGDDVVPAEFIDGTEEEAFLRAVQANMTHGLPLSMADREAAAVRVIGAYPCWSDKAVAEVVGLSPGTVAAIRRRRAVGADSGVRVGRDGRVRPLDWARGRIAASQVIARRPEASLREVAREAGVSPATVRDVRARLQRGEDPVPANWQNGRTGRGGRASDGDARNGTSDGDARNGTSDGDLPGGAADVAPTPARGNGERTGSTTRGAGPSGAPGARAAVDVRAVLEQLRTDPSLRYSEAGRAVWRWLFTHAMGLDGWPQVVDQIPPHCGYLLSRMARRCAEDWLALAEQLERRGEPTR